MRQEEKSSEIRVLGFPDYVRTRPWMYLGECAAALVPNALLKEALCCSRDEALQGRCSTACITLLPDGRAKVKDDGPGLPLEMGPCGERAAEAYLTSVHAGCAAGKSTEQIAQTTCLLTLAVLNALCAMLEVRIFADGVEWRQNYALGVADAPIRVVGPTADQGTELTFHLDASVLETVEFDKIELESWVRREITALSIVLRDERVGHTPPLSVVFRAIGRAIREIQNGACNR